MINSKEERELPYCAWWYANGMLKTPIARYFKILLDKLVR